MPWILNKLVSEFCALENVGCLMAVFVPVVDWPVAAVDDREDTDNTVVVDDAEADIAEAVNNLAVAAVDDGEAKGRLVAVVVDEE